MQRMLIVSAASLALVLFACGPNKTAGTQTAPDTMPHVGLTTTTTTTSPSTTPTPAASATAPSTSASSTSAFSATTPSTTATSSAACDEACLKTFIDRYIGAMLAHDPSRLPLADNVRFTENGQELKLGEALWGTISGIGTYKTYFTDPEAGQVGFFGVVKENDTPVILVLRLMVANQKIAEAETIVARPSGTGPMANGALNLERIKEPNPLWSEVIPPAERMSREDLIKTANMYFSGLQKNDGKGVYPFSDDCNRLENGMQTTNVNNPMPFTLKHANDPPAPGEAAAPPPRPPGPPPGAGADQSPMSKIPAMGCKAQFSSGWYNMVARIRDRRFMVVDPIHGAVFTFVFFDHDGRPPPPITVDGKTYQGRGLLWTWELGEAFKIEKGQIRYVEAVMTQAPYGMKPGWPD